jgi:hypothetical protein
LRAGSWRTSRCGLRARDAPYAYDLLNFLRFLDEAVLGLDRGRPDRPVRLSGVAGAGDRRRPAARSCVLLMREGRALDDEPADRCDAGPVRYAVLVEVVERNPVPPAGTTSPRGRSPGSAGACEFAASHGRPADAPASAAARSARRRRGGVVVPRGSSGLRRRRGIRSAAHHSQRRRL